MIVEKIIGPIDAFDQKAYKVEKVLLDRYDMSKPHQKVTSETGEVIAVSLPHGEQLYCGAVLLKEDDRIVVIDLVPEDVLVIRPKGNPEWAKTAFNIGNMHHPAYLQDDCIKIPYDAIIETMLKKIGVTYERCQCRLDGEKANVVVGGHSHTHSHAHGHEHAHTHHHGGAAHDE